MPTFFWKKYTFKDVYAYLSCLHYKTFQRLKYYFHAFTEYYNSNVRKNPHQSSKVGIVDGFFLFLKNVLAKQSSNTSSKISNRN